MANTSANRKALLILTILFGFAQYAQADVSPVTQPKPSTKQEIVRKFAKWLQKYDNWGVDRMKDAWKFTEGSKSVVVAIIDTGIDPNHPDLKPNLWKAPGNPSVYGWDFVMNASNPIDEHGHGTHIAGIIGAVANARSGTAGVAQSVSLMPIRYFSPRVPGKVNLENTIKALHYAIDNGARIINYSGGGPEFSQKEYEAMKEAESKGILIVAAAGNEENNTDQERNRYYPAAYSEKGLKNIITVASIDESGALLHSSNWGMKSVDVAAPGLNILSTLPHHSYGKMSGTSQATAFVSGLAALILSERPSLTPEQVKSIILKTVNKDRHLFHKIASEGIINARKAVEITMHLNPKKIRSENRATASSNTSGLKN